MKYHILKGGKMKKKVTATLICLISGFLLYGKTPDFNLDTGLTLAFSDITESTEIINQTWKTRPEPGIFYDARFYSGNFLIGTTLNCGFFGNFGTFSSGSFSRPAKTGGNMEITLFTGGKIPFSKMTLIPYGGFLFKKINFSSFNKDLPEHPEFNNKTISVNKWLFSPEAGIQCVFSAGQLTFDFNTGFYPYIFTDDKKNGWGFYEKFRFYFLISDSVFPITVFTGLDYRYISHKVIKESTFEIPLGIKTVLEF